MKFCVAVVLHLVSAMTMMAVADVSLDTPTPLNWYSAYKEYPEYCSTPDAMANRKIPSLKEDSRLGETRLVHVTTVIRHGARTPDDGGHQCWEGYWDDPETGIWNCDLKTQMAPPTPKVAKEEEQVESFGSSETTVLFEKHYDALMDPKNDLSNKLFGTCQTGQLLLQGYEQQVANGKLLRDAYCYDSNLDVIDHDSRMRLMDVNAQGSKPWKEPQLHIRSDDDQRVLVSGQTLVRAMFEKEMQWAVNRGDPVTIPVHLADRDRDVLAVKESLCPRLTEMRLNLEKSSIFKRFNTSKEAHELHKFIKNDLRIKGRMNIMDCLMTTVCTDRTLPEAFDYGKSDMFDRLAAFATKGFNMHLLVNDAEYSKLAMAPLWAEITGKINPIVNGDKYNPGTRLSLISAHDDTVAALMASIGLLKDTEWPAYASMFLIEIHEIIDGRTDHAAFPSKYAFRIVYNGQVLTQQVNGCLEDADLCDIKIFQGLVADFSSRERQCKPKRPLPSSSNGGRFSGPFYSFLVLLFGTIIGGAGMFYYLTGSLPFVGGDGYRHARASEFSNGISMDDSAEFGGYRDNPPKDSNGGIEFLE